MAVYRHELYGDSTKRVLDANKDRQMVNMIPEILDKDRKTFVLKKRPGLASFADHSAAANDTGRGIISAEGALYYVIGNKLYKNGGGTAVGTLSTTTGPVYMDKTQTATPKLIINDLTSIYTLDTLTDTFYTLNDADIPTGKVAGCVFLDGYAFIMTSDGYVYNTQLNPSLDNTDVLDWQATFKIQSQVVADGGVGFIRHVNYLAVFGTESCEIYYNAAESQSPLLPFKGAATLIGCAAGSTLTNVDNTIVWVSSTAHGGRAVTQMEGFTPKNISNQAVETALEDEGADLVNARAHHIRAMGHSFYVLRLNTADVTWIYDFNTTAWHQWKTGSTAFNCADTHAHLGLTYVVGLTDGKVYTLDNEAYQDDGAAITCQIQTEDFSGDTYQNKFLHRLEVVADIPSAGTVDVQWTDDDFQTFSTARTVDLTSRPFITRCGSFQRRAFKLTHTANAPLRVGVLEFNIRRGHYGR